MSERVAPAHPARSEVAAVTWLAVHPLVTLLLWLVRPLTRDGAPAGARRRTRQGHRTDALDHCRAAAP